jgi:uncharacterized repeat protein (TIGR02543 family)
MKHNNRIFIRMMIALGLILPFLFEFIGVKAEDEPVWEQVGDSFYTNAGMAIAAYNGEVYQTTRSQAHSGRLGVSKLIDGAWQPYGNYPVSYLNGMSPDLYVYGDDKYLLYDHQRRLVVNRYDAATDKWEQVGDHIAISYSNQNVMAFGEDGTLYIAYLNMESSKERLYVKKLVNDMELGLQWVDVGDQNYFVDTGVYSTQQIVLRVEQDKVYIGYMEYTDSGYIPSVAMLDRASGNDQWVSLEGNSHKLAPGASYTREIFTFELIRGVPYVFFKEFLMSSYTVKRYQGGEWITVSNMPRNAYYGRFATYKGMLYLAYSETSDIYEAGDWKVYLKRLDGEEWTTVGEMPVYTSVEEVLVTTDLAFDEVERTWYVAFTTSTNAHTGSTTAKVMRIADDLRVSEAPTLIADEVLAPGEPAVVTFPDGDGAWRSAIQYIRNGHTVLTEGVDYVLTPGQLLLNASALHAGINQITIIADGYVHTTAAQLVQPENPTNLQVVKTGYGYVDLAWTRVADADNYRITYESADFGPASINVDGSKSAHRIVALDESQIYTLVITAMKQGVESVESNSVTAEPKLVPDGFGKPWKTVGSLLSGIYPAVDVVGDVLWAVSRDERGVFVHRYEDDVWKLVGPERFVRTNSLNMAIAADEHTAYMAHTKYDSESSLTVMQWDGSSWVQLGDVVDGYASPYTLLIHDDILYVAYIDARYQVKVKAYMDDEGSGAPGWVDLWDDEVWSNDHWYSDMDADEPIKAYAIELREQDGKLYLAFQNDSRRAGYRVFLYSYDLSESDPDWQVLPRHDSLKPGATGDLGFDVDNEGNMYVSIKSEAWKYTAAEDSWTALGSPSPDMMYSSLAVVDGQPVVGYRKDDRLHVWKPIHGSWFRVGDTIIEHSGRASVPKLAEWKGQPLLITYNGRDESHAATFVYDWAEVVMNRGDGSAPEQRMVRIGEPLSSLDELSRDDYEFLGWFDEQDQPFAFRTTAITGDMSLYGDWKIVTPTNLTVIAGDRVASLEWTPIAAATKYKVYISQQADLSEAQIIETSDASVVVEGLTNGTNYYMAVWAFNDKYESDRSAVVGMQPLAAPGVPRNVAVTASDSALTVQFEAPEEDGGSAITSYQVYLDGELNWTGLDLTRTITALENRRTYQVTVTAKNANGEGAASVVVEAMPYNLCFVFWLMRDDESTRQESMMCGDAVAEPELAERPGYDFQGWYDESTGELYDFDAELEYGTVIAARWSLKPDALPRNAWQVLNDLSVSRNHMSIAADNGFVYAASNVWNPDYSKSVIIERFTSEDGWQEIGRFEDASNELQIATLDGDVMLLLQKIDQTSYINTYAAMRWEASSESWSQVFESETKGVGASNLKLAVVDREEMVFAYTAFDSDYKMIPYVMKYTFDEGVVDISAGLLGSDGLTWNGNSALLVQDGQIWYAYADENGMPHLKSHYASGWEEAASLVLHGLQNNFPDIRLSWHDGKLLLMYPDISDHTRVLTWDGMTWNELPELDQLGAFGTAVYADESQGLYALYRQTDTESGDDLVHLKMYTDGQWRQVGGVINPDGVNVMNLDLMVYRSSPYVTYMNGFGEMVLRVYNRAMCTVAVDRLDGNAAESYLVPCGETIAEPDIAVREGYTFQGWYPSQSADQRWDFADPVTADMMLVPRWSWAYNGVSLSAHLIAEAGDGQVQLRWNQLDYIADYEVYMREASGVYGDVPQAIVTVPVTVTDSVYHSVTQTVYHAVYGLDNGTTYFVKLAAQNDEGEQAESAEVSFTPTNGLGGPADPEEPVDPIDQDESEETSESEEPVDPADKQQPSSTNILVNGRAEPIGTIVTATEAGRTVTLVQMDEQKLREMLQSEAEGISIIVKLEDDIDVLRSALNGATVKEMEKKGAILEIQTERAVYRLRAELLIVDALMQQFSGNAYDELEYTIEIAGATEDQVREVRTAVMQAGGTMIDAPVAFHIRAFYGDASIELNQFAAYVERWIVIPAAVAHDDLSTVVVVEPDGTLRHVPTRIATIGGVDYAIVSSFSNSLYTLVDFPAEFADMSRHWAAADVLDLGRRLIVYGRGSAQFSPDEQVTRAEFAAMLVRALGIRTSEGEMGFQDIHTSGQLASSIGAALSYGLIQGYDDNTVRGANPITREQAMVIMGRAIDLISPASASATSNLALPFTDAGEVSTWALQAINRVYQSGLVHGDDQGRLSPKENITRAEAAALLRRMLQRFKLIDFYDHI